MATPKTGGTTNGLAAASKQVVSSTRQWMTAVRDISLAPAMELMQQHRPAEPMLRPWVEMTRTTQDWLLTTWEETASQMIDQGCAIIDRSRR